ncbi:MAG: penicillin acylase family protein [Rhodanobacteraceae bacterium]|nr:MAG: penicillin acylase family protein [Rhodanobacteraceae bacterium]
MRWVKRILVALIVVAAILAAVGWRLLAGSRPQASGSIAARGLSAPVTIVRDANGVPTITARNRRDLAFALGFVHGQERFFQMDLERRVAAGELAALLGKAAIKADASHRQHRLRALAVRELAALPPYQRAMVDAYTAGVNAGLRHLAVRPWEYLLLGVAPEPWTDADSILTVDTMFFDLNQDGNDTRELNIARLRAVLPKALSDFLLAPAPRWEAPLQGGPTAPVPLPPASVLDLRHATPATAALVAGARAVAKTDAADTGIGSNGFAVGGALAGGAALLANDPHLALRVPNVWYRAQLRYPDPADPQRMIDLNGVTLPGAPAMVIGSNGHIAWGFTNSEGDWMDWVRVVVNPGNHAQYKTPAGWQTLQRHAEIIQVKGAPAVHITVTDTIWGPIMATAPDGTPLALAWVAQEPRAVNLNVMKLETATSVQQALALAPTLGIPPQNLVVADARGNIGWSIASSAIPLRTGFDPSIPADWSQPGTGWTGYASPAQDPRIENPADSRIWTANQRIVTGTALQTIGNGGYDLGARAQQIRDDLRARAHFTPRDMLDIQLDDRALFLARWQKLLLGVLDASRDPKLVALRPFVAHWQARAAAGSVGYRVVRRFREKVRENALAPFTARAATRWHNFKWPSPGVGEYAVWKLVAQKPAWLLDPKYQDWNALLQASAREVATELAAQPGPLKDQTWGRYNTARIDNPLAIALPRWLADWFNMPHDELAGDDNVPRVLHPAFGASIRMVVQPGDEARGILEMPAGQSDNPTSPWFGNGHEAWVHGRVTPLLPGPARYRLTLDPRPHGNGRP